jgi:hypothetical protein
VVNAYLEKSIIEASMTDYIWKGAIGEFEKRAGLPTGFVYSLAHEDDWTFVIKIHALYETALTDILVITFGNKKLRKTLAEISMSDKLKFASACDLFDKEDRKMLHALSKLRNKLVHSVDQVAFSFSTYLSNQDQKKQFLESFAQVLADPIILPGDIQAEREAFVIENPRITVFLWCRRILANVYLEHERSQLREDRVALYQELAEAFRRDENPSADIKTLPQGTG